MTSMGYVTYSPGMKKTTFDEFWGQLERDVAAKGLEAVAEFERMQHRFHLGAELSVLRHERGLSQQQLAALTKIDQSEISRIERDLGNPTEDTLGRLAAQLGSRLAFVPDREAAPS